MKISRTELAKVTLDMLEKRSLKHAAKVLAAYVIQNNMARELDTLMHDIEMESARRGLLQAHVTSARPVSDRQLSELARLLRGNMEAPRVHFNQTRDPDIVGGVHINAAGSELDLSVRGKLTRLIEGVN